MTHIVVLTSQPEKGDLSDALLGDVTARLGSVCKVGKARVLAKGHAAEIQVSDVSEQALNDVIARFAEKVPVDFNLVAQAWRQKKLLIADMDSTIITSECIDEIADFAGVKDKISGITERAMRGELEFESALRERVLLLKGLETSILATVFEERIELTSGAKTLVATMRANGAYTALISGGFTFFTERVARDVGFDFQQANHLIEEDGRLAGTVREPILGRDAKRSALQDLRKGGGKDGELNALETMAVGDGANDLAMIEEAGLGVAFRAKPLVAEAASASIQYGDLTALLYLQGYTEEAFQS